MSSWKVSLQKLSVPISSSSKECYMVKVKLMISNLRGYNHNACQVE